MITEAAIEITKVHLGADVAAFMKLHGVFPRRCCNCNELKFLSEYQEINSIGRRHTSPSCNLCRAELSALDIPSERIPEFRPYTQVPYAKRIYALTGVAPHWCRRCGLWKSLSAFKGAYKLAGVYCATCRDIRNAPKVRATKDAGTGRHPLGKRQRFLILRRDNFACRYCGRSAPDVVLHVDHKTPVSLGGTNDPNNLVTACADCNLGKFTIAV
jgi:hypothetical protein